MAEREPSPNPLVMSPFSLYIHIPYCQAKCPYCDFNSYAAALWPEDEYVAALSAEMGRYAELEAWRGGEIQTVFFGGGTPSLFAARSIGRVLEAAAAHWPLAAHAEITLESNPGTVEVDKLRGFRAAGVNRVSFGVQSFHAHHLAALGRIHSADEARLAIRAARDAGFENVSLDLIFALPKQTLAEWEADLRAGIALGTDHFSAYNLTYEEGTPFHAWRAQGKLSQLDDAVEASMFRRAQEILGDAGYVQYEISNYARPGYECRHNLNYWRSGAYLGVGAGAHSFADLPAASQRWSNEKNPVRYIALAARSGNACVSRETLSTAQRRGEFVFLALRCREGFLARDFESRFGASFEHLFPHVAGLVADGLLESVATSWRLTARGLLFADSVFATFL